VNIGIVPPAANNSVKPRRAYANEEVAPPAPVVSQTGEKQFAQRVSEDAEGN